MQQMKASHCLTEMADALAVSKSGFFAHQRKRERPRAQQDNELSQAIEPIFVTSRKTYGSPRIMHALRRSGWRCGKNRIARLCTATRQPGIGFNYTQNLDRDTERTANGIATDERDMVTISQFIEPRRKSFEPTSIVYR